jgi:hypothetical protein
MEKEEQRFLIKYFWMKNWGSKRAIKNSWPHSELMHMAGPKSKSGSRSLETAIYPVRMLYAPGGRP